jgi:hypothetical protein
MLIKTRMNLSQTRIPDELVKGFMKVVFNYLEGEGMAKTFSSTKNFVFCLKVMYFAKT